MAPACPAETVRLEAIAAPPFGAGGLRSYDRIRNQHFNSLLSFFFPSLGLFPFCYSLILEKFLCYSSRLCLRTSGPGFSALPRAGSITSGPAPAAGRPWRRQLGSRELLTGMGGSVGQSWCHLLHLPSLCRDLPPVLRPLLGRGFIRETNYSTRL